MPGWEPGERITDRFVIDLPADLSSGSYELRSGIYRPDNGLRLQVTSGDDRGPDYTVLGRFNVP